MIKLANALFFLVLLLAVIGCLKASYIKLPPSDNKFYVFTDSSLYDQVLKNSGKARENGFELGWCTRSEAIAILRQKGFSEEPSGFANRIYFKKLAPGGRDKINVWVYDEFWNRHDDVDMGLAGIEERRRNAQSKKKK